MDADIIVFDMDKLEVLSTYTDPNHHSLGMEYVLVIGVPVVFDGLLDTDAKPDMPVRRPVERTSPR